MFLFKAWQNYFIDISRIAKSHCDLGSNPKGWGLFFIFHFNFKIVSFFLHKFKDNFIDNFNMDFFSAYLTLHWQAIQSESDINPAKLGTRTGSAEHLSTLHAPGKGKKRVKTPRSDNCETAAPLRGGKKEVDLHVLQIRGQEKCRNLADAEPVSGRQLLHSYRNCADKFLEIEFMNATRTTELGGLSWGRSTRSLT